MAGLQIVKMQLKLDRITHLTYLLLALATVPGICIGIKGSTGLIEIALISLAAFMLFRYMHLWNKIRPASTVVRRLFAGLIIIVFAVSLMLQKRLLSDFSEAASVSGQTGYTLDCREYIYSYNEYQLISGYETEKNALHQFLERQNCI